jgi:LysM repeat protein
MQKLRPLTLLLVLMTAVITSHAQQKNQVIQDYINTYKDIAISEMQRTGVPASIKLAQGIHETMAGTSKLVLKSNNHFGIKCKSNWTGESVSHDDDARGECFRKYSTPDDSYRDHSNFLKNSPRYAALFELDPTDYAGWANGLKRAGYATNPRYPAVIIKLVEEYQLQDYTLIAMGKQVPGKEEVVAATTPAYDKQQVIYGVVKDVNPSAEPAVEKPTYPAGEFRINETRVIFITKGTSYLSIAQQYNVSLARLFDFNEIREAETAADDQLVFLQRKRKAGLVDFHIVKPGETLRDIAQAEGIRLEMLLEYNFLKGEMQPAVGEQLSLRNKSTGMPKLALKDNYSITPATQRWSNN